MATDQKNKLALIRQAVVEGETYLGGQLTLATSADQRAVVLGGVFTAAGTAIIVALIAGHSVGLVSIAILLSGLVSALLFLIGAGLCVSTVMPVDIDLPGNEPDSWSVDIEQNTAILDALEEEAKNYQTKIKDNRAVIQNNAKRFKWGAIAGITAPIAGMVVFVLISIPA